MALICYVVCICSFLSLFTDCGLIEFLGFVFVLLVLLCWLVC